MKKLTSLMCVFFISSVAESAVVIYDSGSALSIEPYHTRQSNSRNPSSTNLLSKNDSLAANSTESFTMTVLPVRTSNLSPGTVVPKHHNIPHFQVPLFLIGSDSQSQNWLVQRRDELKQLNAVGLLVSVETDDELRKMRALADDLWLFPGSGYDVAKELGLKHYPVLISKNSIEQ